MQKSYENDLITIDGSFGSGGGAILRVSTALSAITGKPIKVHSIRAKRRNPGLRPQHLEGIKAVTKLCNAELKNAKIGSKEIEFYPGKIEPKELNIKIKTAGSIGLIFQSLQLLSALADKTVKINVIGGSTASKWSPPLHYLRYVFLPIVKKMGYRAEIEIKKEGFYPKGGARVNIKVNSIKELNPLVCLERGDIKSIHIHSVCGRLPEHVAERQGRSALRTIQYRYPKVKVSMSYKSVESLSPGSSVTCYAVCENSILGGDCLGERGLRAEIVGQRAAEELIQSLKSDAALDKYMSDQILVYLALAKGRSRVKVEDITEHCRTNISVIEEILPVEFEIDREKREISVEGISF